jgi:uncharacterized protein (DUF1501 family)
MITRRSFFKIGCTAGALGVVGRFTRFGMMTAMADSAPAYRALVCVFLFGGNDGNNLVVPLSSSGYEAYSSARKELALSSASLLPVETKNNEAYGFHPKLSELQALFNSSQLAILANVGTLVAPITRAQYQEQTLAVPANLFSHSDQQMQWQTAEFNGPGNTGWAGRAADEIVQAGFNQGASLPAFISVAGNNIMGIGETTQAATFTPGAALGLRGFNDTAADRARLASAQEILTMNTGLKLVQAANSIVTRGIQNADDLSKAMNGAPALKTVFPKSALAAQLEQIAKIIQVRDELGLHRQIFFCSLGGFDTHTAQLNTQDNLFTQLSQALSAFYNATEELGVADSVTTFTESDFGRTLQPNTNSGTDHAWGNHHLILGASVKGGDLYGTFPHLALGGPDDTDSRGRWIPPISLDQYGATLASWFGVAGSALTTVFPNLNNFQKQKLEFMSG